ncbi:hypothetical protein AAIH25_01540 [Arthrobacter crystallopoietes]|uniref:hypothetical protein n=1 Tax=Crystallibacter crystallopoietes TaxID=37928 RepID=UPI003D1F574C
MTDDIFSTELGPELGELASYPDSVLGVQALVEEYLAGHFRQGARIPWATAFAMKEMLVAESDTSSAFSGGVAKLLAFWAVLLEHYGGDANSRRDASFGDIEQVLRTFLIHPGVMATAVGKNLHNVRKEFIARSGYSQSFVSNMQAADFVSLHSLDSEKRKSPTERIPPRSFASNARTEHRRTRMTSHEYTRAVNFLSGLQSDLDSLVWKSMRDWEHLQRVPKIREKLDDFLAEDELVVDTLPSTVMALNDQLTVLGSVHVDVCVASHDELYAGFAMRFEVTKQIVLGFINGLHCLSAFRRGLLAKQINSLIVESERTPELTNMRCQLRELLWKLERAVIAPEVEPAKRRNGNLLRPMGFHN